MWSLEGAHGQPISVGHWISCDSRWVFGVKDGFLSPWFTYDSPDRSNRADRSDLGDHQAKEKPEC